MGKCLSTAWYSCWLFADGGGVNGEDDPDSLEKLEPIWPLAPLHHYLNMDFAEHGFLSAFAEHGFTWHCLLYMKVLLSW